VVRRQLDLADQRILRANGTLEEASWGDGRVRALTGDAVLQDECVRMLEFLTERQYSECELEEAWFAIWRRSSRSWGNYCGPAADSDRHEWYRIDLLLFHRRLRCLVVIDLKIGKFTHADAGQMNLYLNYTREHMMEPGENDPVGLILCSAKNDAVVHSAMGGIKAKVFASHYLTVLPDPETLRQEIVTTQRAIEARRRSEET
jgi:hypothetical protein